MLLSKWRSLLIILAAVTLVLTLAGLSIYLFPESNYLASETLVHPPTPMPVPKGPRLPGFNLIVNKDLSYGFSKVYPAGNEIYGTPVFVISRGKKGTVVIELISHSNHTLNISLSTGLLPEGVKAEFIPENVTLQPSGEVKSKLVLEVSLNAKPFVSPKTSLPPAATPPPPIPKPGPLPTPKKTEQPGFFVEIYARCRGFTIGTGFYLTIT